jgi:hypothetical protein
MQTPEAKRKDKNQGFFETKELEEIINSSDYALLEQIDGQSSSKIKQPTSSVTNTKNQKSITKKEEVEFDELEI